MSELTSATNQQKTVEEHKEYFIRKIKDAENFVVTAHRLDVEGEVFTIRLRKAPVTDWLDTDA